MLIIALTSLRWKTLLNMFTAKELRLMDEPTADNDVLLASLASNQQKPEDKNLSSDERIDRKEMAWRRVSALWGSTSII